ncbi:MAG: hypothetical protein ABR907_01725 [Terracidiphilus sp.]|jgi:hypothetical protein
MAQPLKGIFSILTGHSEGIRRPLLSKVEVNLDFGPAMVRKFSF